MTHEINKPNNEIAKQHDTRSLAERYKANKVLSSNACIIVDTSYSMNTPIEPNYRRIDALREIVQAIKGKFPIIAFSTYADVVTKDNIPEPHGETYMARAFDLAKQCSYKEAILITDGQASDPIIALEEVSGLKLQIMYVGTGDRPEFLNRLAAKAGGFCTKEDLTKPRELTEKIQLLLGEGKETGPICL